MAFTHHPKTATTVSSSEMAEHFNDWQAQANRVKSGFGILTSGASLTLTTQPGRAFIAGYKVGEPTDANDVQPLTASATNHVYLNKFGVISINTTGVAPADTIKLFEVDTNGTGVTATRDFRSDVVYLQEPFQADSIQSLAWVRALQAILADLHPYLEFQDTTSGGSTFRIWGRNGKLQVTNQAGTTVFVDDLARIAPEFQGPVLDKDLNTAPSTPATGDRYIVGPAPTGTWAGRAGYIAAWNGTAWTYTLPNEGWLTYVKDEDLFYVYITGTTWALLVDGQVGPTANALAKRTATGAIRAANANPANADEVVTIGQADARYGLTGTEAERVQDIVGAMATDSATIDFTYDDTAGTLTAIVIANSIGNTQLRDSAALSVIGRGANTAGDPGDLAATASSKQVLRVSGTTLAFGTIDSTYVSDFAEAAQDVVGAMVTGDSDIAPTYDDAAGTLALAFNGVATATANRGVKRNGAGQASFAEGTSDDHAVNVLQAQQQAFNAAMLLGGM